MKRPIRKLFSLLLLAAFCICLLPVQANAAQGSCGQHMTWYGSFGAMEQPPTELMILLRNWENFDLNEYYPITLK